jgi:FkbM family methyltransferase
MKAKLGLFLLIGINIFDVDKQPQFEGLFGAPRETIKNLHHLAAYYLPFNPKILHVGASEGEYTLALSSFYIDGFIYAIEADPVTYQKLSTNLINKNPLNVYSEKIAFYEKNGVFKFDTQFKQLFIKKESKNLVATPFSHDKIIDIPCITVDDWSLKMNIKNIDFLIINTNGHELSILKGAKKTIQDAKVICLRTSLQEPLKDKQAFPYLKKFLFFNGFEMLSHWYFKNESGEATFIRKEIYDALYR